MACVCCAKSYCHKKSPCTLGLRIQVSWCGVSGVSSLILPRINGTCGNRLTGEGNSGNGIFDSASLGGCVPNDNPPSIALNIKRVMLGTGSVALDRFGGLSCCTRTALDDARVDGGSVIVNITTRMSARWDFTFPSLAGSPVMTKMYEVVDDSHPCYAAFGHIWRGCVATPPILTLLNANADPGNFCSANATEGGYAAIDGPFSSTQCATRCENPLP